MRFEAKRKSTRAVNKVAVVGASLFFVWIASCASPRSTPTPSLQDLVGRTQTAIKEVRTYRMEARFSNSDKSLPPSSSVSTEYVLPDRSHSVSKIGEVTTETINVGDTSYTRGFGSETWIYSKLKQAGFGWTSQQISLDWAESIRSLVLLSDIADQTIDGVDCFYFSGDYDTEGAAADAISKLPELDPSIPNYDRLLKGREAFIASLKGYRYTQEFWVAKKDYLPRKVQMNGTSTSLEGQNGTTVSTARTWTAEYNYSQYNANLKIEPPTNLERVNLSADITSTGGGDSAHYQVGREIVVTNSGPDVARDVRIYIETAQTSGGVQTFEAMPDKSPVTIPVDGAATFTASWQMDMAALGEERFVQTARYDKVRASWTDGEGNRRQRLIYGLLTQVAP